MKLPNVLSHATRFNIGLFVFLTLLLAGCGGGGGGSGGGGGGGAPTSFSISGTISGLTGSVDLHNNGGDNLIVTANGTFTFATKVTNGSSYNVVIPIQPANQTCTVSNGVGTVSGGNVTNVAVVCSTSAYSVGGTISGLTGSVVLQNNGGDNLIITANGTFTFVTKVANNSSYSVTVLTQPAGQSCSVFNGNGIIMGTGPAIAPNVTITCATNTYTIGGTVTGLNGSMVLQNNSGDNLTVAANGPFTFPAAVASGNPYKVSVLTQPSPLQTCTVSNGSGTATANISNVAVNCVLVAGPSAVTPTVVSSEQINLSWTFVPPVNDNTSGYAIFRKDGPTGFYRIVGSVPTSASTYNDLNLTPNTTYYYKVYYYCLTSTSTSSPLVMNTISYAELRSNYSTEVSASTTSDAGIPTAPSALTASAPGGFAVNLAWTDNSNNEAGFYIERSLDNITFAQIDSVQPNITTYRDRQVVASKPYYYRIRAYNSLGSSAYTLVATATTPAVTSTAIGGTVYGANTTLTQAGSPYYVSTSIVVLNGFTLTIEPGVEIRFAPTAGLVPAAGMEIRGALKAIGTATAPIIFTSVSPDTATNTSWSGIHIANSLGGSGTIVFSNISFASSGISVDCCGGGGPIDIADSAFANNSNAESSYTGINYKVSHLRTSYTQNTMGISSADKLVYYSKFQKNGTGLSVERGEIKYNIFNSNTTLGATVSAGSNFQYNVVTGSPTGFQDSYNGGVTFSYNLLTNNTVGFMGSGTVAPTSPVNNNIFGNITYNYQMVGASNVTMTNNWWGSTNATTIKATIFDVYNNVSLGMATYQPFLLAPVDLLP